MSHMGKLSVAKMACVLFLFCAVMAVVSPAQTFKTVIDFNGTDGLYPDYVSLIQGTDGNFYGTTYYGGADYGGGTVCEDTYYGCGTVFKITSKGKVTTLYSFCQQTNCTDGAWPAAGLVQGTDGNFYGTTAIGGANGDGTVFSITAAGALTTLYSFCQQTNCTDGAWPAATLVQGSDGNFYGTTAGGGANDECNGGTGPSTCGTAFKITAAGTLTTLYSFCSAKDCTDGVWPYAGLVQGSDGNFYGTTSAGGNDCDVGLCEPWDGAGTVFKITPAGTLTTLHLFCSQTDCTDGGTPYAGLVQASNGNFYGTATAGGALHCSNNSLGIPATCGTAFMMTPAGTLTTLYTFCSQANCTDGAFPYAGLVQGTDGNFYGTTNEGGNMVYCPEGTFEGCGTVFQITPAGMLTTLHTFEGKTDGSYPLGSLVQATNGKFYATTSAAGDAACGSCGTVFSVSMGLGPFVETRPASGVEGAKVRILGQGFDSSSIVEFGGVQATTVKLSGTTFLTATVPAGALTGSVTVTTGSTELTSNQEFRVTPQVKSFTPLDGPVGTVVTITGVGLMQTSAVAFGGVEATAHTVESDTQIKATVPTGAKTGKIAITTPGGTGNSSASFTVTE
jgi:uncharacterized repeat protein (TIGR03803 family)